MIQTIAVLFVAGSFIGGVRAQNAPWPDPVANEVLPLLATGITHGPILGRPTSSSMRVWVRTLEEADIEVVYDTLLPLRDESPNVSGKSKPGRDMIAILDLADLAPDTRYFYGVRVNGIMADLRMDFHDDWPSFRTLPDATACADEANNPKGLFNVCFAVGHCASQNPFVSGGQYVSTPAYDTIRSEHLNEAMFGIVNGDVIYEEERDGTLDGVRDNYKLYFSRGRSFIDLFRRMPAIFTFDDHDVGWDIHGCGQIGLGDGPHLIRDLGLRAYQEYISWANPTGPQDGPIHFGTGKVEKGSDILFDPEADFTRVQPEQVSTIHLGAFTRTEASNKRPSKMPGAGVFGLVDVIDAQHLRITPPAKGNNDAIPYSIGTHHYYDWKVSNCHFFALDTRGERSSLNKKDRNDPEIFILGPAQEKWLMDGVKNTDAEFIFLISPDPWVIYHTAAHVRTEPDADKDDKGDGFPSFVHQREKLFEFFDGIGKPILIFTGDVHASASVRISNNVWEMMCGPLGSTGHPLGTLGNPPTGGIFNSMGRDVEMRWVSGFANNLPYQRIRNTYYGIVQVNNVLPLGHPEKAAHQWAAFDEPSVTVRWHDGYTGRLVYAETITTRDARD